MAAAPEEILDQEGSVPAPRPERARRKILVRRPDRDHSQPLRLAFQLAFLLLNAAIGLQFYLFTRYCESGGRAVRVTRPAGVDGWLPIGGLMNLKYFLVTGLVPAVHPAAMVLLLTFLLVSLIFRKAFCGWLCPVGTISEGLWKLGRRVLRMNWHLPRWADLGLRSLKYLLLALFLIAVGSMSAVSIRAFMEGPYGMVADVKMLNFFRYLGLTGGITLAVLVILSVLVQNFWCRYLCPYGALMGLAALISPAKIRRDPDRCIDCAKCARTCPARLSVDRLRVIRSAECTACMECVAVCPARDALQMTLSGPRRLPPWALAVGIGATFLVLVAAAHLAGIWQTHIAAEVYFYLVPHAQQFVHPGM